MSGPRSSASTIYSQLPVSHTANCHPFLFTSVFCIKVSKATNLTLINIMVNWTLSEYGARVVRDRVMGLGHYIRK